MARKTGTHTYFASPRTERTRISFEVPPVFRADFVDAAYRRGMTQFEYFAYLLNLDKMISSAGITGSLDEALPPAPDEIKKMEGG